MEATVPLLILFLVVMVRLYTLALKQQPSQAVAPPILCRLHRWERTDAGIICRDCGTPPRVD